MIKKSLVSKSGFSLTETMIAVGIIGFASTAGATCLDGAICAARDANRQANIYQTKLALDLYFDDNGTYPISLSHKADLASWGILKSTLENKQSRPYIAELPIDPLDDDKYNYKYWSDGVSYRLEYETEDPSDVSPQIVYGL